MSAGSRYIIGALNFTFSVAFFVAFRSGQWISYNVGDFAKGHRGLWTECRWNITEGQRNATCHQTVLAEGPAFLDSARTLTCLTLVGCVFGIYAYSKSLGGQGVQPEDAQERVEITYYPEIIFVISGSLSIIAAIAYGLNYYDYHANELNLQNVKLANGFYLLSVISGLITVVTALFTCICDPGLIRRGAKLLVTKTRTLKDKLTNAFRKLKSVLASKNQSSDDSANKEPTRKKTNVTMFFLPLTIIQGIRRLKKGRTRKEEMQQSVAVKTDKGTINTFQRGDTIDKNTNDKKEDIFTIYVQNCAESNPAPHSARLPS